MKEKRQPIDPFQLPRGKEIKEIRAAWNPQEPRTPLEFAWLRLPQLVKDYFEIGYMVGNPQLTREKKDELLDKRREMLGIILKDPNLQKPFIDFLDLRDRPKKKK